MFTRKQPTQIETALDKAIYDAIRELDGFSAEHEEYHRIVDKIERLTKLKDPRPEPASRNTLAVVGGNLLGIALIVGHERANVVTSKALNFVLKAST